MDSDCSHVRHWGLLTINWPGASEPAAFWTLPLPNLTAWASREGAVKVTGVSNPCVLLLGDIDANVTVDV